MKISFKHTICNGIWNNILFLFLRDNFRWLTELVVVSYLKTLPCYVYLHCEADAQKCRDHEKNVIKWMSLSLKGDDIKSFFNYKNHLQCVDLELNFKK